MKSSATIPLLLASLSALVQPAIAADVELHVTAETTPKIVNLSAEGKTDWTHWGRIHGVTILNRKTSVRPAIGELVKVGVRELHTFENNPTTFAWSDGAPATEVKQTRSGAFTYGQNAGKRSSKRH